MAFMLVENFERMEHDQPVYGQRGTNGQFWMSLAGPSTDADAVFRVVELDEGKVLSCNPGSQARAWLPLAFPLEAGKAATLYFRVRFPTPDAATPQPALRAGAVPSPLHPPPALTLGPQAASRRPRHRARGARNAPPGAWISVWMVINPSEADGHHDTTYNLYVQSDGDPAPAQVTIGGRSEFLLYAAGEGEPLLAFIVYADDSHSFLLDDIHVDRGGENLSDPRAAAPLQLVGATPYTIVYDPLTEAEQKRGWPTRYEAALCLQEYIRAVTGVKLEVVPWDPALAKTPRIYVGPSAAVSGELDPILANLAAEEYVIYAAGADLILAGRDDPDLPYWLNPYYARARPPL